MAGEDLNSSAATSFILQGRFVPEKGVRAMRLHSACMPKYSSNVAVAEDIGSAPSGVATWREHPARADSEEYYAHNSD